MQNGYPYRTEILDGMNVINSGAWLKYRAIGERPAQLRLQPAGND